MYGRLYLRFLGMICVMILFDIFPWHANGCNVYVAVSSTTSLKISQQGAPCLAKYWLSSTYRCSLTIFWILLKAEVLSICRIGYYFDVKEKKSYLYLLLQLYKFLIMIGFINNPINDPIKWLIWHIEVGIIIFLIKYLDIHIIK